MPDADHLAKGSLEGAVRPSLPRHTVRLAAALAWVILTGACAQPGTPAFRLEGRPTSPLLVPPSPKLASSRDAVRVRRGPVDADCTIKTPVLALEWRGSKARLVPNLDAIRKMTNLALAPHLEEFRTDVFRLQERGCFSQEGADRLLAALASSAPMPPKTVLSLRYGPSLTTGYVDLVPGFRLEDATLIRTSGGRAVGQRTGWYKVVARGSDGVRVVRAGRPRLHWFPGRGRGEPPAPLDLRFPAEARVWRLSWWVTASSADHFNMVIAAVDRPTLDNATRHLAGRPADCLSLDAAVRGAWCRPLSPDTVLTAEIPIEAQGRTVYVPLTANVAQALITIGVSDPESVEPTLKIWRRFGGHMYPVQFDPGSKAILNLPLVSRDRLHW
ncbi:MAG TPA: hypothetical protein VGZ29_08985 [Terriglobia bacterium]|nr:hypothetical protein [Terriglobia bacterium]